MDLEKRYKDETGYDVRKIHDIGMHNCSNDYVKWIEKLVNKNSDIHSVSESFVVSAKFLPFDNKWTGLGVEMGVEGTHKEYNVVYNGDCINEHFDTEQEAKQAALNAR